MKLAILPSWYPYRKNPNSGIFIHNQAMNLAEKIETGVFVLRKGWPSLEVHKEGNLTTFTKSYLGLPNKNLQRLDRWSNIYTELFTKQNDISKYDIIHAHDHLAGYAAYNIYQNIGTPYILTLHNTNFITRSIPAWKLPYIHKVIKHARKVIVVGKKLYETIQEDYQIENLQLIPNYVDTEKFTIGSKAPLTPFIFITVTSLFHKKRIDKMIQAFASISDRVNAELHIVGDGIDRRNLENLSKKLGLTSQIIFHGSVLNKDLPHYYQKSHAYLSSSAVETFGISIIEAMSCGLPIISTPSGGPEYIIDNNAGIISSIEDFDIHMMNLFHSYGDYDPNIIRSQVLEKYSKQAVIPKIINLYKSLLK